MCTRAREMRLKCNVPLTRKRLTSHVHLYIKHNTPLLFLDNALFNTSPNLWWLRQQPPTRAGKTILFLTYVRSHIFKDIILIVIRPPEISRFDARSQYRERRFSIWWSKISIFGFHQNRVLQTFFCSKIWLLMVKCDVLWQFQAF